MITSPRQRTQAFTLIELLIVVAIIAILAAIAVPNFLEAQVRAKTARVKSDFRTIALALESYRVDNNRIPEQGVPNGSATYPFVSEPRKVYGGESARHDPGNPAIAFRLSTPIAYVASTTAVFADPFFAGFDILQTSVVNDTRYYNYSSDYHYGRIYDSTQDNPDPVAQGAAMFILNQKNAWHLRSRGPDKAYARRSQGWEDYLNFRGANGGTGGTGGIQSLYDPTNGTVSFGDVVYFGNGGQMNK